MFTHKNSSTECECRFLKAAGKFCMSFLRIFTLGGKLLKILMQCAFLKTRQVGTWSMKWCLLLVL